jgi:precorrin-2 dehydrogenase/sirohydrochlorin ferrochelatase
MDLFPIFLKIAARPCLVIGAGNLAESKIESLQAAHAKVTVIAPEARPRIADMAGAGEVEWLQREYADGDLTGHFLVVAATNNPAVNRAVYKEATEKTFSATRWMIRRFVIFIFLRWYGGGIFRSLFRLPGLVPR